MSLCILLLLTWMTAVMSQSCQSPRSRFTAISGVDCVNSSFYRLVWGLCTPLDCSLLCANTPKCQAFSLPTDTCQCKLFLFDECSHRVQSVPNCTHLHVTVYVRSLAGVQAGHLCPSGFTFTRYGTSYKVVTSETVTWTVAKQRCSDESGLSKFADALDLDEAKYLAQLKFMTSGSSLSYYIGGFQMPGTTSKTANWTWDACNLPISNVWHTGEPNHGVMEGEGCADIYMSLMDGIDDLSCGNNQRYICECQSVF